MKLKNNLFVGTLMITTLFSAALPAFAEDGGESTSIGDVTFKANDTVVPPINPEDPDEEVSINPIDPLDPTTPGTEGPLSIDYVSNFKFGEQKISGNNETYFAKLRPITLSDGTEKEVANYLQVTDNRGINIGWHLTATQEEQFKHEDSSKELEGATIDLLNQTLNSAIITPANTPTQLGNVTLTPGTAVDIIDAKVNTGMGTWTDSFGTNVEGSEKTAEESVKLSVPGSTAKETGRYETTITWTLTDTPA